MSSINEASPSLNNDLSFLNTYKNLMPTRNFHFLRIGIKTDDDEDQAIPYVTKTFTGWIIEDFGYAIAIYTTHQNKTDELEYVEPQTIINYITKILSERGWNVATLCGGTKMMARLFWVEWKKYGFNIDNYTPNEEDKKYYETEYAMAKSMGLSWEKHAPTPSPYVGCPTARERTIEETKEAEERDKILTRIRCTPDQGSPFLHIVNNGELSIDDYPENTIELNRCAVTATS